MSSYLCNRTLVTAEEAKIKKNIKSDLETKKQIVYQERDNALAVLAQEEQEVKNNISEEITTARNNALSQKNSDISLIKQGMQIKREGIINNARGVVDNAESEKSYFLEIKSDVDYFVEMKIRGFQGNLFVKVRGTYHTRSEISEIYSRMRKIEATQWFKDNGSDFLQEFREIPRRQLYSIDKMLNILNGEIQTLDAQISSAEQDKEQKLQQNYIEEQSRLNGRNQVHQDLLRRLDAEQVNALAQLTAQVTQQKQSIYNQETQALKTLTQSADKAYQDLANQTAQQKQTIYNQETHALQNLTNEENLLKQEIAAKETVPLVYFWYREIVGRDASKSEADYWISRAKDKTETIDKQAIIDYLKALPEYARKIADKETIVTNVKSFLEEFLTADKQRRNSMLESLKLTSDDIVSLNQYKVTKIIAWLQNHNLHFGDSAYLALKALLDNTEISVPKNEIARISILIDILTGNITEKTDGNLLLSLYALNKTAGIKGLTAYSAKIDYAELAQTQKPIVAHVDGNHYIIVTKIENGQVTYTDPGMGENGEEVTISAAEFQKIWQGYVLTPNKPINEDSILTDRQAQAVKGSFFFVFLFLVIKAVAAVVGAVVSVLATVASAIASAISFAAAAVAKVVIAVSQIITTAITHIAQGIGQLFTWVGQGVKFVGQSLVKLGKLTFKGIKFIGDKIYTKVMNPINAIKERRFIAFLTESIKDISIKDFAINYGVGQAVEELNLDPTAGNILTALTTGGILGGIEGGVSQAWRNALTYGTIAGVGELGTETGLDSRITGLAAITSGAVVSGTFNGIDVQTTLKTISPNIAGELAYIGIQELGEEIGVDPRISYLAGIPVKSSVTGMFTPLDPDNPNFTRGDIIWKGVKDGIARGATNVGLEWAAQEAGLDPLEGALASRGIIGLIDGALNPYQSPLKSMLKAYIESAESMLTLGLPETLPEDAYLRSIYFSRLLDFSDIIKEQGLGKALETYAESIFTAEAIDEIYKQGGILDLITKKARYIDKEFIQWIDGKEEREVIEVKEVKINDRETLYFHPQTDNLIVRKIGDIGEYGTFVVGKRGGFILASGYRKQDFAEGIEVIMRIAKGLPIKASVFIPKEKDSQQKLKIIEAYFRGEAVRLDKDSNPVFTEGILENKLTGARIEFKDGKIVKIDLTRNKELNSLLNIPERAELPPLSKEEISGVLSTVFLNGIRNPYEEGVPPDYAKGVNTGLEQAGADPDKTLFVPLYEEGNLFKDTFNWFADFLGFDTVTDEIIQKIDADLAARPGIKPEEITLVSYSGSLQGTIKALKKRGYRFKQIITIGTPTIIKDLTGTNIERVINLYGEKDRVPLVGEKSFSRKDDMDLDVINIKILSTGHTGYFIEPGKTYPRYNTLKDKTNRTRAEDKEYLKLENKIKVNYFTGKLREVLNDPIKTIEEFLGEIGAKDIGNDKYEIDPVKIVTPEHVLKWKE